MGLLIVFYCIIVLYTAMLIGYIGHHIRRYRSSTASFVENNLQQDFKCTVLNLLYLSLASLIICSFVLYKVDLGIITNQPWQIGLGLASATLIFYVMFLLWDIYKHRVKNYFIKNHHTELQDHHLFNLPIILIITSHAILLLETVMSIINMVAYLRS
jgi:hypothetical protein